METKICSRCALDTTTSFIKFDDKGVCNFCHDYDKAAAMSLLEKELGWVYYGGKHYESIYTRFYQAFVLPRKFNIDKRKAHYSSLVCSGQMTRERATELIKEPAYDEQLLEQDREYAIKKLGLSRNVFDTIMSAPNKSFLAYRTNHGVFEFAKKLVNATRGRIG